MTRIGMKFGFAAALTLGVISSAAAQVSAIAPSFERVRPFSCNILASTGNAVMLIAIPINNAKDKNVIPSGAYSL